MSKPFFEVFPGLEPEEKIKQQLDGVEVEKVTSNSRRDFLRIYLVSSHLIVKEIIYKLEKEIKKQLFPKAEMTIKIYEKFQLSSQYNPEKLFAVYRESILEELREYDHILYNACKNADITFPSEDKMNLEVSDSVLIRTKSEELIRIFEKIFNERCGLPTMVSLSYKEAEEGKYEEEDKQRIAMQVAQIYERVKGGNAADDMEDGSDGSNAVDINGAGSMEGSNGKTAGSGTTQTGKETLEKQSTANTKSIMPNLPGRSGFTGKGFKGGSKGFQGYKRSDNPDVIYGRDFEEEAIKIEDVIGEIGEVVIRGKIISFDKRELKTEKTILFFDVTDFTDTMTVKVFIANEFAGELSANLKPGNFVKIKGIAMMDKFDHELTIGSIAGIKTIPNFTTSRDTIP